MDPDGDLLAKINKYFEFTPVEGREYARNSHKRESISYNRMFTRVPPSQDVITISTDSSNSDLSDSDRETIYQPECIICSESFADRSDIGIPIHCLHLFCYECIKKWSRRTNVCPICKKEFIELGRIKWKKFLAFVSSTGPRKHLRLRSSKHVRIKNFRALRTIVQGCLSSIPWQREIIPRKLPTQDGEDNHEGCEICHLDDHWDCLLLCDSCNLGYHTYCLDPPLSSVPSGDWFCKMCLEFPIPSRDEAQVLVTSDDIRSRTAVSDSVRPGVSNRSNDSYRIAERTFPVCQLDDRVNENLHENDYNPVDEITTQDRNYNSVPDNVSNNAVLIQHDGVTGEGSNSTVSRDLDGYLYGLYAMSNDQPANQTDISYMSHSIPSFNSFEDKRSQYENISSQSFGINTYWINSPMSELNRNGRSTCNGGSQPQNWDTNAVHLGTPTDVPGSSQDDVLTNTLSAIGEYVSSTSGCLTDNTTRSPDFNKFAFDTHSLESHGVMESPTGSVQVANGNATERPDRSVSFVYRYRTMMDRTASTRRIETMPRHFTYSDY